MEAFSYLMNSEIGSIEDLYRQYLIDPEKVNESWRLFFKGFDFARSGTSTFETTEDHKNFDKELSVLALIEDYRRRGHLFTKTNPVRSRRKYTPTLDLVNFHLSEDDLGTVFYSAKSVGLDPAPLKDIIELLQQTYCQSIGAEYLYIRDPKVVEWLQAKMESTRNTPDFTNEEKKHFYEHLKQAVGFEQFIHKKFVGQKRFSLEGAEITIPALDAVIEKGADLGIKEFVIGMAH